MGSLKGLRARYLGSFDAKIAELRDALARMQSPDDPSARPEIRRKLHTLAGSGEVYGLPDISSWARDVLKVLDGATAVPPDPSLYSELESSIDVLEALVTGLRGDVFADGESHPPDPVPLTTLSGTGPAPDSAPPTTMSSSASSGLSFAAPITLPPGSEDWRVATPERKSTTKPMIEIAEGSQAAKLPNLADEDFVAEASGPFVLPKLPEDDLQAAEPSSPALKLPPPPPSAATLVSAPHPDLSRTQAGLGASSSKAVAAVVEAAKAAPAPPTPAEAFAPTVPMRVQPRAAVQAVPVKTLQMVAHPPPGSASDDDSDEDAILPASSFGDDAPTSVLPMAVQAKPADPIPAQVPFNPITGVGEAEYTVLVVDDDPVVRADIEGALDAKRFRIFSTASPEEALDIARQEAPDLVILDGGMPPPGGFELFDRLRGDPLTSFLSFLFVAAHGELAGRTRAFFGGAIDWVAKPFDKKELAKKIERHCAHTPAQQDLPDLGDATLEEVVAFVEREIRRGLLESAEAKDKARIVLGQGAELLATTWNLVGRFREIVARMSNGAVRFRAVDHGRLGVLSLHIDERMSVPVQAPSGPVLDLGGRRVLVVDDDVAVRTFFANVLEEVGAKVDRAPDGRAALDRAAESRPDVIISDILMPEMDGWELCRALRRDFTLRDVPVILLSWKEDFVQRMKELDARADAYILKESQKPAILERVRSVLRPRMLVEQRLAAGGEVTGRVDSVGIVTLLGAVCRHRGDAKIKLRENWNLFEIEIRAGVPVAVTRTSTDGSMRRGGEAFDELIAADGGRFTVMPPSAGPARSNLTGSLEELVAVSAARLGGLVQAVSDAALLRVTGVTFRAEALETYLAVAPERVREIVKRLAAGQPPPEIMDSTGIGPQEMERVLVDLVKRGAIHAVLAPPARTETSVSRKLADEERWKVLARSDESEPPDVVSEEAAEPPAPEEEPEPEIDKEARKSLAPSPPVAARPSQARVRKTRSAARTMLMVGTALGLVLWGYILVSGAGRPTAQQGDPTHIVAERGPAPITVAATAAPMTAAPMTAAPTTAAPQTAAEATAAPVTTAPATAAPATAEAQTDREEQRAEERRERRRREEGEGGDQTPREERRRERREEAASGGSGTLAVVSSGDPVEVIVDDRPRGQTPLNLTLSGGLHEIGLKRGDSPVVFRYVVVREGQEVRLIAPRMP